MVVGISSLVGMAFLWLEFSSTPVPPTQMSQTSVESHRQIEEPTSSLSERVGELDKEPEGTLISPRWMELTVPLGTGWVEVDEAASLLVLYNTADILLERSSEWTITLVNHRWKKVETKRLPGSTWLTWRRSGKWMGYIAGVVGETPFIYLEDLEDPSLGWFRGGPMPEALARLEEEAKQKAAQAAHTEKEPELPTP